MSATAAQILIQPRSARIFGPIMITLGVLSVGAAAWTMIQTGDDLGGRLALALFSGLFGAMMVAGGRMLTAPRGGVAVRDHAFELMGDCAEDRLRIDVSDCSAVAVTLVPERRSDALMDHYVCEALLRNGPALVLGESDDERGLGHFGHRIAGAAGLGEPVKQRPGSRPAAPTTPPPPALSVGADGIAIHVGLGGHLAATLSIGAAALLVTGVVLLLDLANNNVLGFLFGPLLIALGLALGVVPATKLLLVEHLKLDGRTLHHHYKALGREWGHRGFELTDQAYVRLRQRGLHGAAIEVSSDGRILIIGGGVHHQTTLDHAGLRWAAQYLAHLIG